MSAHVNVLSLHSSSADVMREAQRTNISAVVLLDCLQRGVHHLPGRHIERAS